MIYKWPRDLLRPDIVICLIVPENTRQERMAQRGEGITEHEKLLEHNEYRQR